MKDMPMETPEELPILAYSRREDPRECTCACKRKENLEWSGCDRDVQVSGEGYSYRSYIQMQKSEGSGVISRHDFRNWTADNMMSLCLRQQD